MFGKLRNLLGKKDEDEEPKDSPSGPSPNNNDPNPPAETVPIAKEWKYGDQNVVVEVIPQSQYALVGVQSKFHVLFQILTAPMPKMERPPLDLAVVLDRSGSMEGSKLKNSKRAIKKILKHLTPSDRFHLITYDDNATIVFRDQNLEIKEKLFPLIQSVRTGGGTNLHIGVKEGLDVLLASRKKNSVSRNSCIFLFSDGLANVGISSKEGIWDMVKTCSAKDVSVSAFGIGDDFDEVLMKGIAEHGRGKYAFIDSAASIPKHVSKAIHGLMALTATNINLKVVGDNGAIVTSIGKSTDLTKGFEIRNMVADNNKSVLVSLDLKPDKEKENENILNWQLTYLPPADAESKKPTAVQLKGSLAINFTKDSDKVTEQNEDVMIAVEIKETADRDKEIADLVSKNQVAKATEMKEALLTKLKSIESKDKSKKISKIVTYAERDLVEMKKPKKNLAKMKKSIDYHAYKEEQNSAEEFESASDSDSEEYSDDDDEQTDKKKKTYFGSESEEDEDEQTNKKKKKTYSEEEEEEEQTDKKKKKEEAYSDSESDSDEDEDE